MASLFIKDQEANTLAKELADKRGLTKTAAVKLALRHELDRHREPAPEQRSARDILERIWRDHPLGEATGLDADKAFYDSLNDERGD